MNMNNGSEKYTTTIAYRNLIEIGKQKIIDEEQDSAETKEESSMYL